MNSNSQKTPYLSWEPALAPADVFAQAARLQQLSVDEAGRLYWIESRPDEAGRCVLVMRNLDGSIDDLISSPFSARNRVMEYGANPYFCANDRVWFSNFADQRIYSFAIASPQNIQPLSTEKNADGSLGKYADFTVSPDGRWLVFVYEKEVTGQEPLNALGIMDLHLNTLQEAKILVAGADFYKTPQFSADGKTIAWLEWNHPHMPWDSTILKKAAIIDGSLLADSCVTVAGSKTSSINSFAFADHETIFYNADFAGARADSSDNFSNIFCWSHGISKRITKESREIYAFNMKQGLIAALIYDLGRPAVAWIDKQSGNQTEITLPFIDYSPPVIVGKSAFMIAVSADQLPQLILLHADGRYDVIKKGADVGVAAANISRPITVDFPTTDGGRCYGYFYAPANAACQAPDHDLPPVRVLVHGGPTSMAKPGFSQEKTYWTSQGYAIFDVNYRGSVGFGRKYRDTLLGQWGVLEIQDVKDGLEYLKKQGMIGELAVVSGGSAGGYTVQRLLTFFPDLFAAGASHFGIGNLVTLQLLTHKFESRYLEGLIGGPIATHRDEFAARSPINHLENLKSPMIIFQGADDKVVPPENSREMAEILAKKGIRHEYHEYAGEGHGFRLKDNLIDSLQKESAFFKRILQEKGEGQ